MDKKYLDLMEQCKEVFDGYAKGYDLTQKDINRKYVHTFNVAKNSFIIGEDIFTDEKDRYICYVIGLLHDLARFEQWKRYSSYKDTAEFSHAEMSAKFLFEDGLIKDYPVEKEFYDIVNFAIYWHGALKIDKNETDETKIKFAKMIRDADKLDIFRESMLKEQTAFANEFAGKGASEKVLDTFYQHQCINKADCNSVLDRAILQLAMVYDLNYDVSKTIYLNNEYFKAAYINYQDKLDKKDLVVLKKLTDHVKNIYKIH